MSKFQAGLKDSRIVIIASED